MKNTKEDGRLRFLIYKSGDQYVGVCLDIDERVFESTAKEAFDHIISIADAYIEMARKDKISLDKLNQHPRFKYLFIWYFGPLISTFRIFNLKEFFDIRILPITPYGIPSV